MTQLSENISKCTNNTSDKDKYQWLMPVVPVFSSLNAAKNNGLDAGQRCNKVKLLFSCRLLVFVWQEMCACMCVV